MAVLQAETPQILTVAVVKPLGAERRFRLPQNLCSCLRSPFDLGVSILANRFVSRGAGCLCSPIALAF
eukprot:1764982-Amphidinium_carterae.1